MKYVLIFGAGVAAGVGLSAYYVIDLIDRKVRKGFKKMIFNGAKKTAQDLIAEYLPV